MAPLIQPNALAGRLNAPGETFDAPRWRRERERDRGPGQYVSPARAITVSEGRMSGMLLAYSISREKT